MPLTEHMEVAAQQYCLRWKYHHSNLQVMFAQLLERESFCDVTLACEGRTLRAHKMMLSACSTYFDAIFSKHEEKDPIVILKDVKFDDIKALVEFMYKGEINVENSQLNTLLQTAEELRIKGLAAVSWRSEGEGAWRSVEPASATGGAAATSPVNPLNQNLKGASNKPSQQSTRKRKMKVDYSYVYTSNKKAAVYSGLQQSADDYAGSLQSASGGDEDSQEGMWDTRSHEEAYSESEDVKPRISNSNSDSLSVSAAGGESTAQAENDEDERESRESPPLSTYSGNGNGSTNNGTSGTPCNNTVCNNVNSGAGLAEGNSPNAVQSTPASTPIKQELMDVMKMTAYIQQGGRRPHFWETSSTKRIMEAIKNKEIEMKVAAELLGVSYGTLYGRYRDAYGCLKHPYRVREFWHEPPSVEVITKLQRKELSLFKAAEMLNVTVTTLANYLAALNREEIEEGDDDVDGVGCVQRSLSIKPDITIVKKEKDDPSTSVNGNK